MRETRHLVETVSELIAIPSVSADPARVDDVGRAADWVCDRIRAAGGAAELVLLDAERPLAVGEIPAARGAAAAPTVLCYGHFDVQPPAPLELWESDPFTATVRDGWVYGRGVADDKAQLFMLLEAAARLAREGELPVNVRFVCDGEEEILGDAAVRYLEQDERPADAAVIFDGRMLAPGVPAFCLGTRGICYLHVRVQTGERDLHSGVFGGVALNATHALVEALAAVVPRQGRLPEPLRAGITPPTPAELESWERLPPGRELLADQGAQAIVEQRADDFYVSTWAEPSLDVNGIGGGEPTLVKTVLPAVAEANLSVRLAPGQDPAQIGAAVERLLRDAVPDGAEIAITSTSTRPAIVDADAPAVRLAQDAFEAVVGARPLLVRTGGSLPIAPALAERHVPVILTGFALPDSNIHAPNERLLLEYLPLGVATARELFLRLAALR